MNVFDLLLRIGRIRGDLNVCGVCDVFCGVCVFWLLDYSLYVLYVMF